MSVAEYLQEDVPSQRQIHFLDSAFEFLEHCAQFDHLLSEVGQQLFLGVLETPEVVRKGVQFGGGIRREEIDFDLIEEGLDRHDEV